MDNLVVYSNQNGNPKPISKTSEPQKIKSTLRACSVVVANFYENHRMYEINIMATGFKAKHFQIHVVDDILIIKARKRFNKDEFIDMFRGKFNLNSFSRRFRLPGEVDSNEIEYVYKEGVLKLVLPKRDFPHSQKAD